MKGEIWWFVKPGAINPAAVIHDLDHRGLASRRPGSGDDRMVCLNPDGTRRQATIDEVGELFNEPGSSAVAFLWLDHQENLGFGPLDGPQRLTFDLDGLNWAEAQRVTFPVVGCALATPAPSESWPITNFPTATKTGSPTSSTGGPSSTPPTSCYAPAPAANTITPSTSPNGPG